MSPPAPKRACDQCHTLKEKCRRSSATTSCERCDRLSQTCKTTRSLAKLGRKPHIARKLSYNLPSSKFSLVTCNTEKLDVYSFQNNKPYPHACLPFDEGLFSNPALFPELDKWERYFLNLMKDLGAPSPLDKFLIGPSFHESHHRFFVQNLLRAPTSILKDATVACAAVLLGAQYAQYTKTSVEVGYRRAALAISGLRSLQICKEQDLVTALILGVGIVTFAMHVVDGQPFLISRYTLALVKPVYHTLLTMDPSILDLLMCLVTEETFECLIRSETPTIRIGERDRCDVVDRYIGISSPLFGLLYDLCDASHSMRVTGGRMDIELVERLDAIQDSMERWKPSPPPDFIERFTQSEVVGMLTQAKVLRLAACLIIHRLRHPHGQHDKEALRLSSAIMAEIDMALKSAGRSIPCMTFPYTVACFEITGIKPRAAVVDKIPVVVTFSRQLQLQVRRSLSSVWDGRDGGDQIYWFNLDNYIHKTPSTWTDV